MPREHSYSLRPTWPDELNDYLVIDERGDRIARIYESTGSSNPDMRWRISVGAHQLPVWDGRFNTGARSFEDAKVKVKELWPVFRAHWSDEEYEKAKRNTELHADRQFSR